MTRYIDADALKESVHAHDYILKYCLNSTDKGMFTVGIMQAIDEQPTVETDLSDYSDRLWKIAYERGKAEAVKRGKWLWLDGVRCSKCNYKLATTGLPSYCPNCGARMDEE